MKLKQKTEYLEELEELMKLKDEDEKAFKEGLDEYEMEDEDDLKKTIEKLSAYITKANNKKLGIEEETKVKIINIVKTTTTTTTTTNIYIYNIIKL